MKKKREISAIDTSAGAKLIDISPLDDGLLLKRFRQQWCVTFPKSSDASLKCLTGWKIEHRGAMVPVTSGINKLELWTSRRCRVKEKKINLERILNILV